MQLLQRRAETLPAVTVAPESTPVSRRDSSSGWHGSRASVSAVSPDGVSAAYGHFAFGERKELPSSFRKDRSHSAGPQELKMTQEWKR